MFISIGKRPEQTFTPAGNIFGNYASRKRGGGNQPTLMQGSQQEKENQIARQREEELYARDLAQRQAEREADRQAQFDLRAQEREAVFQDKLSQNERLREINEQQSKDRALSGLVGLFDSYTTSLNDQSLINFRPSEDLVKELNSYINENLRSGALTRQDIMNFNPNEIFGTVTRPQYRGSFGNYILNVLRQPRGYTEGLIGFGLPRQKPRAIGPGLYQEALREARNPGRQLNFERMKAIAMSPKTKTLRT